MLLTLVERNIHDEATLKIENKTASTVDGAIEALRESGSFSHNSFKRLYQIMALIQIMKS